MKEYRYETNCICCGDGDAISEMKDGAISVSLQTMRRRRVDFNDIVRQLGYDRSFPIHKEPYVYYYKGEYKGGKCYFLRWSGIEYIFIKGDN